MRNAIGLIVDWFVINKFRKRGTQINWVQYKWSHVGVWERLFHHQVCNACRHWWHSRSQMSHETSDIFFNLLKMYYEYVRVGLHGPGWLYALGMPPRADVTRSTPRIRATDLGRGPNLRMGSGRAPCPPRSREHEERPAVGREKKCRRVKKHIYIYIYIVYAYICLCCGRVWYDTGTRYQGMWLSHSLINISWMVPGMRLSHS